MVKRLLLFAIALLATPFLMPSSAPLVYVTPSGTTTGSCSNGAIPNYTVSQLNSSANWGTGSTQIGAGTTILWCGGTFTGTQNTTLFSTQGAGTSGNPITFTFDTNTVFSSPQWSSNGAIIINHSWIVWNGTNLTIENTLNGTQNINGQTPGACLAGNCSITAPSEAIAINASNVTVENTAISHMYVHTFNQNDCNVLGACTPSGTSCTSGCAIGESTTGINVAAGATNALVTNNTIDNVGVGTGCATNSEISFNTYTFSNHPITCAINAGTSPFTGIKIHNNDVSQNYVWDEPDNQYHHNGIFFFTAGSDTGTAITALVYYNFIHGLLSNVPESGGVPTAGHTTSTLFLDNAGGSNNAFPNMVIARNVFVLDTPAGNPSGNNVNDPALEAGGCLIACTENTIVVNNTVVAQGFCIGFGGTNTNDTLTSLNNLCETSGGAILAKPVTLPYPPAQFDYDQYPGTPFSNAFAIGTPGCGNPSCNVNGWSVWSASPYFLDVHGGNGTIAAAALSTTAPYVLQAGSTMIGAAQNLTSAYCGTYPFICVGAPSSFGAGSSNNGTSAGATGPWENGAYPFGTPPAAGTPTFVPGSGTYSGAQSITITSSPSTVICYNFTGAPATNGGSGCTAGTLYSGPVTVSINETLFAVGGGTGYSDSSIGAAAYIINPPVPVSNKKMMAGARVSTGTHLGD